ncbi:MAG: hypothetical protein JWQ56_4041, partial [Pseudarthrobacter sp.]|nr:hypothetical protein [Pseudarthrobacter sp.]
MRCLRSGQVLSLLALQVVRLELTERGSAEVFLVIAGVRFPAGGVLAEVNVG